MQSQSRTKKQQMARKKFIEPPVKLACLSCRASRVRCDGLKPCSKCTNNSKACVYQPSRRGQRKGVSSRPTKPTLREMSKSSRDTLLHCVTSHTCNFIAALLQLDIESSSLLDHLSQLLQPKSLPSTVRLYRSEEDILAAYYKLIHPSFPVLPPPKNASLVENESECGIFDHISLFKLPYRPRSALSLAIASVLALIPHPEDRAPSSEASRSYRLVYSRVLFQMAVLSIESEQEADRVDKGLCSPQEPFHPDVPTSIEKIIALLILAIYEYLHHGSLQKMQYRAGQALALALGVSLDCLKEEEDQYTEARRRAFWMTYYCVLHGHLVGSSLPSIMNRSDLSTAYPRFAADPNGWSILIESQRVLMLTAQITSEVDSSPQYHLEQPSAQARLEDVYGKIHTLLRESQSLCLRPPMDTSHRFENHVALKIRILSRIQLLSAQIMINQLQLLLCENMKGHQQFVSPGDAHPKNIQRESRNTESEHPEKCGYAIRSRIKAALAISSLVHLYADPASLINRCGDSQDPRPIDANSHLEATPIIAPILVFGLKQASSVFASEGHQACMAQRACCKQDSATSMPDPLIAKLRQSLERVAKALSYNSLALGEFEHVTGGSLCPSALRMGSI